MRRGKQKKPQGNNGNRKPKSGSKKPSPLSSKNNRGYHKNQRSFADNTQRLSQNEYTWTVDPDTKDVVVKTPFASTAKRLASSFPPTIKFKIGEDIEDDPWESDESEDEEFAEFQRKLDSVISEDSDEDESEDDSDLELQFHEYEDQVLQNDVLHDDLVMDYIQNLELSDNEKPFVKVTVHENYDMDTLKHTEPEIDSPVSSTRKDPNHKQRKRQSLPGTVQPKNKPKRNVRSAQNSPNLPSHVVKAAKMKQWQQGEVLTDSRPKESPAENKKPSKEEDDDDIGEYYSDYSDSENDRLPGQFNFSSSDSEAELEIDDRIDMSELFGKKKRAGGPVSPVTDKFEMAYKQRFSMRDLHNINRLLRDFIQDEHGGQCMPFAPMSKIQRVQLNRIATFYGFKISNLGAGKRMYPQLSKTSFTKLVSMETSTNFLEEVFYEAKTSVNYDDIENIKKNGGKSKKSRNSPNNNNYDRNGKSSYKKNKYEKFSKKKKEPKSYEGTPVAKGGGLVGQHASPIAESNLGNKLLRSMGWSGGGLGPKGEGITKPVDAVIKHDKRGLGFEKHSL